MSPYDFRLLGKVVMSFVVLGFYLQEDDEDEEDDDEDEDSDDDDDDGVQVTIGEIKAPVPVPFGQAPAKRSGPPPDKKVFTCNSI